MEYKQADGREENLFPLVGENRDQILVSKQIKFEIDIMTTSCNQPTLFIS